MAVQVEAYRHITALLQSYERCNVPTLTNPTTVAAVQDIFFKVAQLDPKAIKEGLKDVTQLGELLRKVDGAQLFVRPFLPVFQAAGTIINAGVVPVSKEALTEQIQGLMGLGIDQSENHQWNAFYESVVAGLVKLATSAGKPGGASAEEEFDMAALAEALETEASTKTPPESFVATAPARRAASSDQYAQADLLYFKERDFEKVVRLLDSLESCEVCLLRARALTKLHRFEEAQKQFGRAFDLATDHLGKKHLILHRRAVAYLSQYKESKQLELLEGCVASLQAALNNGRSFYMALVALDAFRSAEHKDMAAVIEKKYNVHDVMWACAAILCEDPAELGSAFEMMKAFSRTSAADLLKEKDSLKALTVKKEVDLPVAIVSGWHVLMKNPKEWAFLTQEESRAIYPRLLGAAKILLDKGLYFLACTCARDAWAQGRKLRTFIEPTLLYASALAQAGNFEQLGKWGSLAWHYARPDHSLLFSHLMSAFINHHYIVEQRTCKKGPDERPITYTVSGESVKRRLDYARALFPKVWREPYWRKVLQYYFPGEDFSKPT